MTKLTNPTEIARDALRQLAAQRVAPTPDNYRQLYFEISGASPPADVPGHWRELLAQTLELAVASQLSHAPDLPRKPSQSRKRRAFRARPPARASWARSSSASTTSWSCVAVSTPSCTRVCCACCAS